MGISSGGGEGRGAIFTEINITPLTDIFLVLLIIMMVIAPLFQDANHEITVPKISEGQGVEQENKLVVEVVKEGTFYVKGEEVPADQLESKLSGYLPDIELKHIVVKADVATKSSVVMQLFEAASSAGYEKMTIAGEPLNEGRSRELRSDPTTTPEETDAPVEPLGNPLEAS